MIIIMEEGAPEEAVNQIVHAVEAEGFRPYWHQRVPPNDGGIALGQVVAAQRLNH